MQDTLSPFAPQRREEARAEKRAAVLRAAVRMFNDHGFHQTSLDDVAARLGISKPTIYHYLGNKDQVLLECVVIGLEQLLGAARQSGAEPGTGADRLKYFLRCYARIIMDDYGRCIIRTAEEMLSEGSRQRFRALKREINEAMLELIEKGVADGSVNAPKPKLLAFALAGALNWPARWHDPEGAEPPEKLASDLVDLLAQGFEPHRR